MEQQIRSKGEIIIEDDSYIKKSISKNAQKNAQKKDGIVPLLCF